MTNYQDIVSYNITLSITKDFFILKDLNSLDSTDGNASSSFSTPYPPNHLNGNFRGPTPAGSFYSGPSNSSRESSLTPVHMRRMSTPRVDSPRLDSYRYR